MFRSVEWMGQRLGSGVGRLTSRPPRNDRFGSSLGAEGGPEDRNRLDAASVNFIRGPAVRGCGTPGRGASQPERGPALHEG